MKESELKTKVAELIGVSSSASELAFELFLKNLVDSVEYDQAVSIDSLGTFQLKRGTEPGSKDFVLFAPSHELENTSGDSLYLKIDINYGKREDIEFDENIFSPSIGKSLLTVTRDEDEGFADGDATLQNSINDRSREIISEAGLVEDFDVWDRFNKTDAEIDSPGIVADEEDLNDEFSLSEDKFDESTELPESEDQIVDDDNLTERSDPLYESENKNTGDDEFEITNLEDEFITADKEEFVHGEEDADLNKDDLPSFEEIENDEDEVIDFPDFNSLDDDFKSDEDEESISDVETPSDFDALNELNLEEDSEEEEPNYFDELEKSAIMNEDSETQTDNKFIVESDLEDSESEISNVDFFKMLDSEIEADEESEPEVETDAKGGIDLESGDDKTEGQNFMNSNSDDEADEELSDFDLMSGEESDDLDLQAEDVNNGRSNDDELKSDDLDDSDFFNPDGDDVLSSFSETKNEDELFPEDDIEEDIHLEPDVDKLLDELGDSIEETTDEEDLFVKFEDDFDKKDLSLTVDNSADDQDSGGTVNTEGERKAEKSENVLTEEFNKKERPDEVSTEEIKKKSASNQKPDNFQNFQSFKSSGRKVNLDNKNWILYLLAAIIVIVGMAIAYFFIFAKGNSGSASSSPTVNQTASINQDVQTNRLSFTDSLDTNTVTDTPSETDTKAAEPEVKESKPEEAGNQEPVGDVRVVPDKDSQVDNLIFFDGKNYNVQVSSWMNESKSVEEAKRLLQMGHQVVVKKAYIESKGGTWYRVRIGNFKTLEDAKQFLSSRKY